MHSPQEDSTLTKDIRAIFTFHRGVKGKRCPQGNRPTERNLSCTAINILLNGLIIVGIGAELQIIAQGLVLFAAVLVSLDRKKIGIIK